MADDNQIIAAHVLSSIAHDLRSPLNAVIGFSKIMIKGLDGPLTDMQLDDLGAIHTSGQLMLEMVNQVIDLGKLEAGTLSPGQAEVYLTSVLERAVAQVETLLKDEAIHIQCDAGDPLLLVRAEEAHIQQIVLDLTLTAAHLIQAGTVTLSVQGDRRTISVTVEGQAQDELSLDAPTILEAYRSGGASQEHRVDLYSLKLLVSERRAWLYDGKFQIEQPTNQTVTLGFSLPTTRSQI